MAFPLRRLVDAFLRGFLTAMPITLISFASCVSYTQLITPTPLSVSDLAAASFFSAGASNLILNWVSSCPYLVSAADMTFTLFIKSGQNSVVLATTDESLEVQTATAYVSLHLGAVLLGIVFIVLGKLRALKFFSYLPYPVIAGFLAMIGAAVVKGAAKILINHSIDTQQVIASTIALVFSLIVLGMKQLFKVSTSISGTLMIIVSVAVFYLWAFVTRRSVQNLAEEGWLLPPNDQVSSPLDIFKVDFAAIDFRNILPGIDALALVMVATLNRALTVSAIESTLSDKPYSADKEMSDLGVATILGGSLGGVAMNPTSAMTSLCKEGSQRDEVTARCTVAITSICHLVLWAVGFPLTNYLPRFLLAGLLLQMGLGMVLDWAILVTRRLQWTGSITIYAMVLVSVCTDMTTGIALGIVVALGFLSVRFAKLEVLKYHVSGIHFRSGGCYSDVQRGILRKYGNNTQIIGLTGFVFEGVAISLAKYLHTLVIRSGIDLKTLAIDCTACQGVNDSACFHLQKVVQMCARRSIAVIFCNLDPYDEKLMRSWNFECEFMGSMADALEKAEHETVKHAHEPVLPPRASSVDGGGEKQALSKWLGEETTEELLSLARLETVATCEMLSEQDKCMDCVYIAVPGYSDVQVEVKTGTANKPAVLMRTTLGAVCAPEALIDSHSRGTWRARAKSVVLRIQPVHLVRSRLTVFQQLMSIGLNQQLQQTDQLSDLYTLSKGGGWRGATFDAETNGLGSVKLLGDIGPRLRRRHAERERASSKEGTMEENRQSKSALWSPPERPVAAVLHRNVTPDEANFEARQAPAGSFDLDEVGDLHTFDLDGDDAEENLILNRYSARQRSYTTPASSKQAESLNDLFTPIDGLGHASRTRKVH